jgi:RHS repeat-associated protein
MLNVSNKTFMPTAMNDYKERFTYNPDGGIITLQRNGAGNTVIDNANWSYYANTHRLEQIADPAGRTGFDAGNQSANNYAYNEIGEMTSDAERGLTNDWTVYGKLKTQTINGTTITYTYDATGNRISKQLSNGYKEFYVRDASGNVMSIYRSDVNTAIAQTEVHLYGSSRIGMTTTHTVPDENIKLLNGFIDGTKRTFTRGEKTFELGDHRSNNLVTISDRRQQVSSDNNTVESYVANIITAQDYSSFGSILQNRKYGLNQRYTYNAKQLDSETGWQDYGMRNYLVDVPVFGSVDALAKKYAYYSPYQFAGNTPIQAIDVDGLEPLTINKDTKDLVVILLGYGGDPPNGATQASNAAKTKPQLAPDNALGSIVSTVPSLQIGIFASSQTDNTKNDVITTIKTFRSQSPDGNLILIGHSGGADNIVELAKNNKDVTVDLMITLDVRDPKQLGWTDTNIPSNVKNEINYYQNTDKLNFVSDRKMNFSSETNGVNILSPGSNHRSIDNDQLPNVIKDINNQLLNRNPVRNAADRVQPTYDPEKSNSPPISK